MKVVLEHCDADVVHKNVPRAVDVDDVTGCVVKNRVAQYYVRISFNKSNGGVPYGKVL